MGITENDFAKLLDESARIISCLHKEIQKLKKNKIVGYAVTTKNGTLENAAFYNINEGEKAFIAFKEWGGTITGLCVHPDAPDEEEIYEKQLKNIYDKEANRSGYEEG